MDEPHPSRLMLGWSRGRPLHVVAADNIAANEVVIITAYEPVLLSGIQVSGGGKREVHDLQTS